MSQKTWGGRFSGETDHRVEAFTESISFDRRLYRQDITASKAHARMLAEVGLLTCDEAERIAATLDQIAGEIERGEFAFSVQLEDIHTHIERSLIERLGDVGRKLHTARSRNDQVVTDVKLWVREAIDGLDARLLELQRALLDAAERERELVLPGYTHLQRAQSVIALHLAGWAEEWVPWSTMEFGFLDLPDAFCTGSSIMPHKKNPDVLELIRGKSARVIADLQQLLVLVKGLPFAYNRDLQEDKVALFDACDTVAASLELGAAIIGESRFRRESIAGRLEDGFLDATTL